MLNINSFTKIRFFTLLISIISALLFTFVHFAYAEETDSPIAILREPLAVEFVDDSISFQADVINEGLDTANFLYGIEIYTPETDEGVNLIDVGGEIDIISLNQGETETLAFTYQVRSWLEGEYNVYFTLYGEDGTVLDRKLVDSMIFLGTSPDIEILNDSCVYKEGSGNIILLSEGFTTYEGDELDISCLVVNKTDSEQAVVPRITIYAPTLVGEMEVSNKGSSMTIAAGNAKEINFNNTSSNHNGSYGVRLSLDTEPTSNTAVFAGLTNIVKEKEVITQTYEATKEEQNAALYAVVALLALTLLLAILIYKRKSNETLPAPEMEMHNPEN